MEKRGGKHFPGTAGKLKLAVDVVGCLKQVGALVRNFAVDTRQVFLCPVDCTSKLDVTKLVKFAIYFVTLKVCYTEIHG